MAKMTTEELISTFEEMTVLELKEFLDEFGEKFDVTAAARSPLRPLLRPAVMVGRRPLRRRMSSMSFSQQLAPQRSR